MERLVFLHEAAMVGLEDILVLEEQRGNLGRSRRPVDGGLREEVIELASCIGST